MTEPLLPTFFVIGAPKCGTSSLHHYLGLHPEISMTSVKEPQLFAGPTYDPAGLEQYERLLSASARVRGESSAVYSQFPRWPEVPERIHQALPGARFVYLVGDPVDRIVAHHAQRVLNGGERRSLTEAVADFEAPDSLYVCASRYATQVERYLRMFPASQLLVVDKDDMLHRREQLLAEVFGFLGVHARFRSGAFHDRLNTREDHRLPTGLGQALRETRLFQRARTLPLPGPARRPLRRLVSRELERPTLDERLRRRLVEALRDEVDRLRALTGREFAGWSL